MAETEGLLRRGDDKYVEAVITKQAEEELRHSVLMPRGGVIMKVSWPLKRQINGARMEEWSNYSLLLLAWHQPH